MSRPRPPNETLASYNGNLKTIQTRLHQLDLDKVKAEQGEAAAAAADQQRVKYAQDALTTVSRLKNYVQLADSVDSSHDFVVPLYNIQGKDPEVNGMIGGVIKVLLGQINAADKKAVYTSEFVRVEADLIKLMKGIYEDAPKSRMEYQTVTMPHLAQSISTATLELKEMQEKVAAVKNMVQAKTKGMEVDKTYHAVLLQRYEQAQASRVENTKQCAARMKSYAAASQRRNDEISEAQLNKKGDTCFTAGCGLTADTPCYKEWTGATGAKVCLLSKPTDSRDGTDKQNPGWLPVCPATVMGEMHACAPKAFGSSVCNPHMNLVDVVQQTADQNGVAPVDCKLTEWGPWSACSKTCGMGHRFRQRGIVQAAQGNGAQCEDLLEKVACDSKRECPLPGGNICSHVKCSMHEVNVVDSETGAVVKHRTVKVSHHNKEENGIAHHCAFNAYSAACSCVCHHGAEYVSPLYNPTIKN